MTKQQDFHNWKNEVLTSLEGLVEYDGTSYIEYVRQKYNSQGIDISILPNGVWCHRVGLDTALCIAPRHEEPRVVAMKIAGYGEHTERAWAAMSTPLPSDRRSLAAEITAALAQLQHRP